MSNLLIGLLYAALGGLVVTLAVSAVNLVADKRFGREGAPDILNPLANLVLAFWLSPFNVQYSQVSPILWAWALATVVAQYGLITLVQGLVFKLAYGHWWTWRLHRQLFLHIVPAAVAGGLAAALVHSFLQS